MSDLKTKASEVLREFKGDTYVFGSGVLDDATGKLTKELGQKAMFVGPVEFDWFKPIQDRIIQSIEAAGAVVVAVTAHPSTGPGSRGIGAVVSWMSRRKNRWWRSSALNPRVKRPSPCT